MNNKVPKIFVNKINKINNNKEVFYSFKNNNDFEYQKEEVIINEYDIQTKIDKLFRTNNFIYKKNFHIKTKSYEKDYTIISKSYDYLLTIEGQRIYIKDIIDIY